MTALAFALALAAQQPQPVSPAWYTGWRLVSTDAVHVGLRPAAFVDNEADGGLEVGVGATLQVSLVALP